MVGPPTDPPEHPSTGAGDPSHEPVSTLRGAGTGGLDIGVVGRVVGTVLLVALAASVVIFFVAGLHKNTQISELHQRGVPVPFTISGCLGLLGGSGSNGAGYTCRGSYSLGGHRDGEPIPGNTLYRPGTVLKAVAVPGDPALVTTARLLAGEETSGRVFVLPAVLLVVLLLLLGGLLLRRRRRTRAGAAWERPSELLN